MLGMKELLLEYSGQKNTVNHLINWWSLTKEI